MPKTYKPKKSRTKEGNTMTTPNDDNIRTLCPDCSKKVYPNSGKFTAKQLSKAKLVKAMFEEEGKLSEHMWIKVSKVETLEGITNVHGCLDNEPVNLEKIEMGDQVMVSASKIEDIRTSEEPKKEEEEDNDTCELCKDEYPGFLDTRTTTYVLCCEHLFDLVTLNLKPKDVLKLREVHGNRDMYLDKEFYDKKGHNCQ
jgi:uncharacterized protein YegJ (DUF2314 family)